MEEIFTCPGSYFPPVFGSWKRPISDNLEEQHWISNKKKRWTVNKQGICKLTERNTVLIGANHTQRYAASPSFLTFPRKTAGQQNANTHCAAARPWGRGSIFSHGKILMPRHTMRQIAATSRLCLVCQVCHCDMSHEYSNQFESVPQIAATKFCRSDNDFHVTRGDLLQQPVAATCRSDLSHRVSRPLRPKIMKTTEMNCLPLVISHEWNLAEL